MHSRVCESHNLNLSRAVWMSQEAGQLYDTWTHEVISAAQQFGVWERHIRLTERINPSIIGGTALEPYGIFRTLVRKGGEGLLPDADAQALATERLLLPRKKEILHYTSATSVMKDGISEDAAVAIHAHDGLRFAMTLGIGLADDVFMMRTHKAKTLLKSLMHNSLTSSSPDTSPALEAIKNGLGPLWDTSLEQPGMEQSPDKLERFFALQRLVFIAKSLRNHTLQANLEEFSVTALAQLGNPSITLESRLMRAAASNASYSIDGWQYRAHRFGLLSTSNSLHPESVLSHDMATDVFTTSPKVIAHLRNALRQQNREGLDAHARKSAGNVQNLEPPLSIGCPVHSMGSIPAVANFGAEVIERMITYHQER